MRIFKNYPALRHRLMLPGIVAVLCLCQAAMAVDTGITVTGSGEAKAKPTSMELNATLSADAELTADAVVKFNDARKKSLAALEGLKLSNLTISPQGMSVSSAIDEQAQMRMMQGMGSGSNTPPKTKISEQLKLTISGIDQLPPQDLMTLIMKVVDTGRDAGLTVGPPVPKNYYQAQIMAQSGTGNALVQFKVDDANAPRDQAYKLAMAEARSKAERLASLAGVKLGLPVSVQEGQSSSADPQAMAIARMMGDSSGGPAAVTVSSGTFAEIPVKVTITVQFSIEK